MIIEAIAFDTCRTMTASVYIDDLYGVSNICLSLPVAIDRVGILRILHPELSDEEIKAFQQAGDSVQQQIQLFSQPGK